MSFITTKVRVISTKKSSLKKNVYVWRNVNILVPNGWKGSYAELTRFFKTTRDVEHGYRESPTLAPKPVFDERL